MKNYNLSVLESKIWRNRRQAGSSVAAYYSNMIRITRLFCAVIVGISARVNGARELVDI